MKQASFRGISFHLVANSGQNGRSIAVHNYPQSDQTWVEDLGRSARHYAIKGFLIGGDYLSQKMLLTSAIEQQGPGLLIHPLFGVLQVSVISYSWREPDYSKYRIDFDCEFIEYSNPVAGLISQLASSVIGPLADALSNSAIGNFLQDTASPFSQGMMGMATSVAGQWGTSALLQGTGTAPIAALGNVAASSMGNSLLNQAVGRDSLSSVVQKINPAQKLSVLSVGM